MAVSNNYFKIGAFALFGLLLFLAGLLAFGLGDAMFKKRLVCVTFFDRSVQGLSEDSAVKFRGFKVGKVTSISLASLDDSDGQPLVKVLFEIEPATLAGQEEGEELARAYITRQTEKGLRVILSIQGITGIGFLDLDYSEEQPRNPERLNQIQRMPELRELVYIPSSPGQIMEIGEAATRIVKSLSDVDFQGISGDLKTLVNTVERAVSELDTGRISADMDDTLNEIRLAAGELTTVLRNADEIIKSAGDSELGREVENTVRQFRQTLKRLDQIFNSSRGSLPVTMDNLRAMSENFRELSELLKDQPSQALFGDPPRTFRPVTPADGQR